MNMTVQKNGCISHILKSHWNRNQIKGALLKCAEENENKPTFTGCVVVSSVCRSAVERIEELEEMQENGLALQSDMDKTIQELRKENAELKARLNAINLLTPELEKMSRLKKQQLIEAKGLLIGFISKMKNTVYTPYEKDLVERAEQFLKGLEK